MNAINEKILHLYNAAISGKHIKATQEDQKPEDSSSNPADEASGGCKNVITEVT